MNQSVNSNSLTPTSKTHGRVAVYHIIFFLSGVAGLGYQMAWTRMFAVGLGHEMPSMLAVVAAFFGGLALGSWALDGVISRSDKPGHWYVWLELLIGLWGLVSIWLIGFFNDVALQLIGVEPSPIWHWAVAFGVPLVVLLPATTAMGATLPAMERFVSPLTKDGRCIGGLYSANTAGAVAGTLASAFLIIPWLGFGKTVAILAAVNFVCVGAVVLFGLERRPRAIRQAAEAQSQALPRWRIAATVFFTGLLGIGYEVLGVRVMSQVMENTVYSFAAVLSVYLLGTAVGAALYQRLGQRWSFTPLLGYLLCGLASACMLGVASLAVAKSLYAHLRTHYFGDSVAGVMASEMVIAAMVFGLPTVLMGATFSHLVQGFKRSDGGVGRAAAVNTLGGAMAPLLFGVVLLPLIGAKWALVVLALSYLVLIPRSAKIGWVWQTVPVILVLTLPQNLQVITKVPNQKIIDYREGVMAAVAVVQDNNGDYTLRVNNRFRMGSTDPQGVAFESLQAHVPLLLHPNPKRALFLGLGTAITFRSSAFQPGLQADGVELVPEVVDVLGYFKPVNLPEEGARQQKIYIADARRFVRATGNQYDVIVADLFHPGRDGAGSLYTLEHFQSVRDRLAPSGLFCQWLPLYQLDEPTLRVIIKTFLEVFPNTRGYLADFEIQHPALGLVGTIAPKRYPTDWFEKRVQDTQLKRYLKGLFLGDSVRLFGSCVADTAQLRSYAGDASINTDDHPVVTFTAPEFTNQQDATSYGRLLSLLNHSRIEPSQILDAISNTASTTFADRLLDFIKARDKYIHGQAAWVEGRQQQATDAWFESASLSVDFTTAYARCLALADIHAKTDLPQARTLLTRLAQVQPHRPDAQQRLKQLSIP